MSLDDFLSSSGDDEEELQDMDELGELVRGEAEELRQVSDLDVNVADKLLSEDDHEF